MFPQPFSPDQRIKRTLFAVFVCLVLLLWLLPMLAVVSAAVRPFPDIIQGNLMGWPSKFDLVTNIKTVFTDSPFAPFLWNTVKVAIPCTVLTVGIASLAAYGLSIIKSGFSVPLLMLFIVGNFVPFPILLFPVRAIALSTGLYDTTLGLVLFHCAFQVGFCAFFLRNFVNELPGDIVEAARIDGVSEIRIYWFVILPLMRPALAAVSVIQTLNGQFISRHHLTSAASLIAALPPVILFFVAQKQFISGLSFGSSKG